MKPPKAGTVTVYVVSTCGAKTRSGGACKNSAMENGRCRLHGGLTPRGVDSPHFKTGEHQRRYNVPERMKKAYLDALNDPELLDLNQSIALIDARIADLLTRVDSGESGTVFKALRSAHHDLEFAVQRSDSKGLLKAMAELDDLIGRGRNDALGWSELRELLDDRRKHVETKQRIELSGDRAVSVSEIGVLFGAFLHLVQTVVSSPKEKKLLADGIERLIAPTNSQIQ